MRDLRQSRVCVFVLVVAALGLGGGGLVLAGFDCLRACQDTYAEQFDTCNQTYADELQQALADRSACFAGAQSIFDYLGCINEYNSATAQAGLNRSRCVTAAQTELVGCIYDCTQSPAAP